MKNTDTRSLSKEAQEQNRKLAIKLLKEGMTFIKIAKIIGVARQTVHVWWNNFKEKGYEGLLSKKRGVKIGTNSKLDSKKMDFLKQKILEKTPDELGLFFSLWTLKAIKVFIEKSWGINVSPRTVCTYMKNLGFTPQKPIKQAYKRNKEAVSKWIRQDYPKIKKKAKKEKAEIHWVDETGLRSDQHYGRSYSKRGKTPVIQIDTRRIRVNLISSVTNRGKIRFMTYYDSLDVVLLKEFMRRLIKNKKNKIFVILDNLRVHHSKKFKKWIEERKDKIEVFYLPPYSPDLNPDEILNCDLKTNFFYTYSSPDKCKFKNEVTSFMKSLQRNPKRGRSYFRRESTQYAA